MSVEILEKTIFLQYAIDRTANGIEQRTVLTVEQIQIFLSEKLYVPIGTEKNRVHKLFYSIIDKKHFIVIHDEIDDEVITILYVHYHNRFKVSEIAMQEAERLMTDQIEIAKYGSVMRNKDEPEYRIRCSVQHVDGTRRYDLRKIGRMTKTKAEEEFESFAFLKNSKIRKTIARELSIRGLSESDVKVFKFMIGGSKEMPTRYIEVSSLPEIL